MATNKNSKELNTTLKASSPSREATAKKDTPGKNSGAEKIQTATAVKQKLNKTVSTTEKMGATHVAKTVSNNDSKTATSVLKKEGLNGVAKKSKEPVKKTTEEDKSPKTVASKKDAPADKKLKAEVSAAKEPKAKTGTVKNAESAKVKPVVIPKTSTDKKVDYEPDFMKSVLDTPASVAQGPTMRYSDVELQEFRELIGKKLDAAKKELTYLQGLITRRDEMGGDETDNRYMTMEDGGMSMEREQLSQMASRQITFIDHLEKALMRIENKTYGICRVTGKLIDKARLRAVPHATLSMEAKTGIAR